MFKKLKNKKGFTLIEIIVVIVILAVLMAVAVPSVMSYMNEGKNAKYQSVARAVLIDAQTQYAKAVADGKDEAAAKTAIKTYVEGKTYTGLVAKAVTFEDTNAIELSGGTDAAEKDVTKVTCTITVDGNPKKVTIDTNKKVTVSEVKNS
ncbi:MAG: prepilin-type N-terminal cleavage/methylation domain-containing protein [Kandleria vitulina]|uniref:prepilin-type N-terminal cleavage/methylation domain-containing protein n=1 Tax=Kandleria vitulina TaxID=1630 RepID=UPI002E790073|nr:prepilin-type N-terminal cleavage/methylation domain-containing protein [Kandleria vitulina]MEE0988917.1 prepilin-type N-terminal cleavage/methylation domain-containing protein [Kandleria vitulina]